MAFWGFCATGMLPRAVDFYGIFLIGQTVIAFLTVALAQFIDLKTACYQDRRLEKHQTVGLSGLFKLKRIIVSEWDSESTV